MQELSSKLLVVDDEEPNRDLLSRRLRKAGFDVECASSATEALAVLEREQIDLILLDNMMPGMSGIDLLKILRATEATATLPVIMVTALAESSRVVEALSTGANDYVTKPIDFPIALARVEAQLQRYRAEQQLRRSEERLKLASGGTRESVLDWNLETGELFLTDAALELNGFPAGTAALTGQAWLACIHPTDAHRFEQQLCAWKTRNCPDRTEFEHRVQLASGACRWLLLKASIQTGPHGQLRRLVGSLSDVTAAKAFDPVTGLGNHFMLEHNLEQAPAGASLVVFCFDRHKVVLDNLGQGAANKLMESVATRVEQCLSQSNQELHFSRPVLTRPEQDELAILLGPDWPMEAVESLARRIIVVSEVPLELEGRTLFTSANAGICRIEHGQTPEQVLRDSLSATSQARLLGRGRMFHFAANLRGTIIDNLELENDLRLALESNQFLIHYQPKIILATGRLRGFEALLRWRHPRRGMVPPDTFIPIAEQSGLMVPLGNWVMREACRAMRRWVTTHPKLGHLVMSVNVSAYQVKDGNMVERVRQILEEVDLAPHQLHLEVTESAFIADTRETMRIFDEIKSLGVDLNLDDFGTGYSSLQYLSDMRFDALKIDKSFLRNMVSDAHAGQLVQSMLGMAKSLSMDVVAEGVETSDQLEKLIAMGCKYGQGYLFSKPVPEHQALEILVTELKHL